MRALWWLLAGIAMVGSAAAPAVPALLPWLVVETDGVHTASRLAADAEDFGCGGVAPQRPWSCRSGPGDYGQFVFGFATPACGAAAGVPDQGAAGPCYVGTLSSELSDDLGHQTIFACSFVRAAEDVDSSCSVVALGGGPPVAPFHQECRTAMYGTRVPPGVGAWRCFVHATA